MEQRTILTVDQNHLFLTRQKWKEFSTFEVSFPNISSEILCLKKLPLLWHSCDTGKTSIHFLPYSLVRKSFEFDWDVRHKNVYFKNFRNWNNLISFNSRDKWKTLSLLELDRVFGPTRRPSFKVQLAVNKASPSLKS